MVQGFKFNDVLALFTLNQFVIYKTMIKQKGYVTVLTLILFSALGLSLFAMFNSGQIVTHKLKLQNAVDAATYSSANVVAREMNYLAYTNRAMVSNQLAIGQMVGLASWSKQMLTAAKNLDTVAEILSLVGIGVVLKQFTSVLERGMKKFDDVLLQVVDPAISNERRVIQALATSQKLVDLATKEILEDTYIQVLQDNNDSVSGNDTIQSSLVHLVSLISQDTDQKEGLDAPTPNSGNSFGFGNDQGLLADYDDFARVVIQADDGFVGTKKPSGRSFEVWSLSIFGVGASIQKVGGNEFERVDRGNKYTWDWSAMDTIYGHADLPFPKSDITLPLAWGAAHATEDSDYDSYTENNDNFFSFFSNVKSGKWGNARSSGWASMLAVSKFKDNQVNENGSDLNSFYKYNEKKRVNGPEFVAVVAKGAKGVRTRNAMHELNTGSAINKESSFNIEKKGNLSGGRIFAAAKAQVYFFRPPDLSGFRRKDERQEFGNMFNPYWQVRLVNYNSNEVEMALGNL